MTRSSGLTSDDIETQRQYYQSNPPSCLSELNVKPADLSKVHFDGHGEALNSFWVLRCRCGSADFQATMYSGINDSWSKTEPVLVNPVSFACVSCNNGAVIFDSKKHGYDIVATGDSYSLFGPDWSGAERVTYSCPNCQNTALRYIARFEYPNDLYSDSFSDFRGTEQDLFSWISLIFLCPSCRSSSIFFDCECA